MISTNSARFHRRVIAAIVVAVIFTALAVTSSAAWAAEQPTASLAEGSARADEMAPRKNKNDVGIQGHGFVASNGVFTTIDAPRAGFYIVVFGVDESGKTVGGYVDDRGRLHGFLKDKEVFTVIDFSGAAATFVSLINAQGQIVGAYSNDPNAPALELSHGFLLDNGTFTQIDVPGTARTQPFGINNLGQIVGEYVDTEGQSQGFLLDGGAFTTIDAPGGRSTIAFDIDDSGRIVGISATGSSDGGRTIRGFLRDAQGGFTPIDVPHTQGTVPRGINNRGEIVGEYAGAAAVECHGFLLDERGFTTIDAPDARGGTRVFDIDDGGRIAGAYDLVQHGYVRHRRGKVSTFNYPDAGRTTEGIGINSRGQIVGLYIDAGGTRQAFLLDNGAVTVIDVPSAVATVATDINNRGEIVGGYFDDVRRHGFLLSNGVFTTLTIPGAFEDSNAVGINDQGRIVGLSF
jgi:uncharacterized membrane protein